MEIITSVMLTCVVDSMMDAVCGVLLNWCRSSTSCCALLSPLAAWAKRSRSTAVPRRADWNFLSRSKKNLDMSSFLKTWFLRVLSTAD